MQRIRALIEHHPDSDCLTFQNDLGDRALGRKCSFLNEDLVSEMLRRADASLELHNVVDDDLRRKGRCVVALNLTQEQYARLVDQSR